MTVRSRVAMVLVLLVAGLVSVGAGGHGAASGAFAAPSRQDAPPQSTCFADAERGWVAGSARVWRTGDGGQTWATVLTSPAASGLGDEALRGFAAEVQCVGADVAWVLFTNPGAMMQTGWALYRTGDGGQHWMPVAQSGQFFPATGAPTGRGGWNRVWLAAVDASTAYVAGVCVACSLPGSREQGTVSLGAAREGGARWEETPPIAGLTGQGLVTAPVAVSFPTAEEGWLVTPAAGMTVYHTRDGGMSWQAQPVEGGAEAVGGE